MSDLILVAVLVFVGLLLAGVPIAFVLVLAAVIAIVGFSPFDLQLVPLKLFSATNSFPLLAIPLFVLAGALMSHGGMSKRLIDLARAIVGNVHGGVAMVSIVACMFFAAVSGSTAATTAAIGIVLIPAMIQSGFSRGAAVGLQAVSGTIGVIVPPSVPFVLLGVIAEISIGDLFLGGVLPGAAMALALMTISFFIARFQGHKRDTGGGVSIANIVRAASRAFLPLMTLVIVMGGIFGGFVTPTEAAILAVVWALLVGFVLPCLGTLVARSPGGERVMAFADGWFAVRSDPLGTTELARAVVDSVKVTGIVVLVIGATAPFAWLLTVEQVPQQLAESMLAMTSSGIVLKLMMLVILLVIGTVIDLTPAMILLVPILQPIAHQIGMTDVHFGVMLVLALAIGQATPPVGISLFVACSVGKAQIGEVGFRMLPFLAAVVVVLLLVTFIPGLSEWLPALFASGEP